jgi:hypothetical protein
LGYFVRKLGNDVVITDVDMILYIFKFEICYCGLLATMWIFVWMLQIFEHVDQLMLRWLGKQMVGTINYDYVFVVMGR